MSLNKNLVNIRLSRKINLIKLYNLFSQKFLVFFSLPALSINSINSLKQLSYGNSIVISSNFLCGILKNKFFNFCKGQLFLIAFNKAKEINNNWPSTALAVDGYFINLNVFDYLKYENNHFYIRFVLLNLYIVIMNLMLYIARFILRSQNYFNALLKISIEECRLKKINK